jgi:hypothetical protein
MNHRHRKVLHAVFGHPISTNIHWSDLTAMLGELGAEIDNKSGNRVGVTLNGHKVALRHANHSLPREEVVQVRHFLETCGIDPADYPA